MSYSITIELPGLPATTNGLGRKHWAVKAREATYWKQQLWFATLGRKPKVPLQKAEVTLVRYSSVQPDFDGLVSSGKHLIDGLIYSGIIADDKPANIGYPTYRWEMERRMKGHIKIIVTEAE